MRSVSDYAGPPNYEEDESLYHSCLASELYHSKTLGRTKRIAFLGYLINNTF